MDPYGYDGEGTPPFYTLAPNNNGPLPSRPPPGLSRNPNFQPSTQSNPNSQASSRRGPPPGLGPAPYSYPVSSVQSNNSFFQHHQGPNNNLPGYPYYSPPSSPLYTSNNFGSYELGSMSGYPYQYEGQGQAYHGHGLPLGRKPSMESSECTKTVIEPMIENLVGSMGMANGTYSHFGPPSNTLIQASQPLQQRPTYDNNVIGGKGVSRSEIKQPSIDPFSSTLEGQFQQKMELKIRQKQLLLQQQQQLKGMNSGPVGNKNGPASKNSVGLSNKSNENGQQQLNGRPPTPAGGGGKDSSLESNPRPQTPGKPSYLEILTKNCPKTGTKTTVRKTSSSGSGPSSSQDGYSPDSTVRDSPTLPFGDTYAQQAYPLSSLHNQSHRKSGDGFTVIGSSSTPSNSSTASSSPVNKPKVQQKGKENSASATGKVPSSKSNNGPAGPAGSGSGSKRAQSINNNGWIKKLPGRSVGRKVVANSNTFDFEIDDLDDDEDEGIERSASISSEGEERSSGSAKKKAHKEGRKSVGGLNHGPSLESPNINNNGTERRISGSENGKAPTLGTPASGSGGLVASLRKQGRDKNEKPRSRKEERNCVVRRLRVTSKQWLGHLMKALTWLWTLLLNVTTLSVSLGCTLMEDFYVWWKASAVPNFRLKIALIRTKARSFWSKLKDFVQKKKPPIEKNEKYDELLAVLGPERNITLPVTGDDALNRLLSVRGQDPYSILGVRSDSPEDTIRRYYKKQAVLVHPDKNLVPGAEEAFKILAKAFEMVGEPNSRLKYHQQLLEAHAKERFMGEFGSLFEELRKKMETACTTIRCTKCKARHKKNRTERPLFAARFCAQCRIHHGAREGELWAEKSGLFGFSWQYYACMANQIWEINEWGRCQRSSLKHLEPNAHSVLYRLVSGGQQAGGADGKPKGKGPFPPDDDDLSFDPENLEKMDDWDSLINNLCRSSGAQPAAAGHKSANGHAATNGTAGAGSGGGGGGGVPPATSAKKRKGKRK